MFEARWSFLVIYCPTQAGSVDMQLTAVCPAVWQLAAAEHVKNRQFSTFLQIFAGPMWPSHVTNRSGYQIPGYLWPLTFKNNFLTNNLLNSPSFAAIQSAPDQKWPKTDNFKQFSGQPLQPIRQADRPADYIPATDWACRFFGMKNNWTLHM